MKYSSRNSPPRYVTPAFSAIRELANDVKNHSSKKEQTTDIILLKKRLESLQKKNKKWAAIMTLLVTGSVATAVALARVNGYPIPPDIIKSANAVWGGIKASGSVASKGLKVMGTTVAQTMKFSDAFYKSALTAPFVGIFLRRLERRHNVKQALREYDENKRRMVRPNTNNNGNNNGPRYTVSPRSPKYIGPNNVEYRSPRTPRHSREPFRTNRGSREGYRANITP